MTESKRPMPRNQTITVRVSEAEHTALERDAAQAGLSLSEFVLARSNGSDLTKQQAGLFSEMGGTGLKFSGGSVFDEPLRQLSSLTLRIRAFREMSDNSATIGAIMHAFKWLMRGVTWREEAGGPSLADRDAALFLGEVREDMSHTWDDFVAELLSFIVFGWSWFEIVWKRRRGDNRRPGLASRFTDGKIGIRKLSIRRQDSLVRWKFDDEGGVQGMVQQTQRGMLIIPIDKSLHFKTEPAGGNPESISLFRQAYRSYFFLKRIEEIEAIGIERDLAGIPKGFAPAEWFQEGSAYKPQFDQMKDILRNIRNDEQAFVMIPSVFDPETKQRMVDIELLGTGSRRLFDTTKIKEQYKRDILMSVLADVIMLGHEQVGSYALASSKTNLLIAGLNALINSPQDIINRHLVPRLMRLNGMQVTALPRYVHGDFETGDLTVIADFLAKVTAAGAAIFPSDDGELERWVLEQLNAPTPPRQET